MITILSIKKKLSNKFVKNAGWLGGAELLSRALRILLTIFIARLLTPNDYGIAAISITMFDIISIFANNNGIGTKLVQVSSDKLDEYCNTSYWLSTIISPLLFLTHVLISYIITLVYNDSNLFLPLIYVGLGFLLLPLSSVQGSLLQRENNFKPTAYCGLMQTLLGSLLTIVFAWLGYGSWALILPSFPIAIGWCLIMRYNHPWRNKSSFTLKHCKEIFHFGKNILFIAFTDKLRDNADYLLVGKFLGVDALGLYYFAFNAGLGISLALVNNFLTPLYSYLCEVTNDKVKLYNRYLKSIKLICLLLFPLVFLQFSLAPFYVPIIYGSSWLASTPVLMTIILSALVRPFSGGANKLLTAINRPDIVSKWNVIYGFIFIISLVIGLNWGVLGVSIATVVSATIFQSGFYLWTNYQVFKTRRFI